MITLEQLGQNIKARDTGKKTQDGRLVDDIPDNEIAQLYLAKHPERRSQVDETASFVERVGSDWADRAKTIGSNKDNADFNSLLDMTNKTLQNVGEVAGGVSDVGIEGLKSLDRKVTGGAIERGVESGMKALGQTVPMQKLGQAMSEHPEITKDVEAVGNIAALAPIGKGVSLAKDAAMTGLKDATRGVLKATGLGTKIQDKAVASLEQDLTKYATQTKAGVKRVGKIDDKTAALDQAGTTGKPPQRVLAESKIIPEHEGTKFRTKDQADKYRESIQPLHDALGDAISTMKYSTAPTPINELQQSAISRVSRMAMPEGDRAALLRDIKEEFDLLRQRYGESMTIQDMYDTKPAYWGGTKFDSTKPFKGDSYYQVGKSFQQGIEDTATKAGYEDVAQLNREIGDRLEAAKFLESLDGQTLKYGKLGKYVFMGIGASLGQGIVGKVLGALGGEVVGQMLIDVSVASPVKRLILKSIADKSPEAYKATLEWMKKQGIKDLEMLQLPPGATQLPMRSGESFVKSVTAPKGEPGRTPKGNEKGGQFFRTFNSNIPPQTP